MTLSVYRWEDVHRYFPQEVIEQYRKKPKNPSHKLDQDDMQIIINKARDDRENIKTLQSAFETDMKKGGGSLSSTKLERLKDSMNRTQNN